MKHEFELKTLGGLSLRGPEGAVDSLLARPKRAAVLAYLTVESSSAPNAPLEGIACSPCSAPASRDIQP